MSFSQEITQREIKRSTLYYHYQSYNEDIDTAKKTAKQGLISLVSNEVIEKDLKNISNVYIDNIKFLIIPLEGENKVISYVLKTDVTNDKPISKELKIIEVKETPVKIDTVIQVKEVILKGKEIVIEEAVSVTNNISSEKVLSTINQLIACNTDRELYKLLNKLNSEGKLRFNWHSERFREKVSSQNYNIVLIDKNSKDIVSFNKKNSLENLKNDTNINKSEFNNYIQVWIELY
jgi:hypothetical protein